MSRISIAAATTFAAASLALAACGDDNKAATSGGGAQATPQAATTAEATQAADTGGQALALTADSGGALKFDKTELTAKAGSVTITLANPSDVPHAIELEGNGVEEKGETVTKGGTSTLTADVKAGTYDYYCPVGNHRGAGMEGTLTVE